MAFMRLFKATGANGMASIPTDADEFTYLRGQGYTGTMEDMRRQMYLVKLTLTEPQLQTNSDLRFAWLGSLGYTGSMGDRVKAWRDAGSLV